MFNAKLSTVRNMKRLRICVLMSVCPLGSWTLFSASFSSLARGGSGILFWTRGTGPHVAPSSPRPILCLVMGAIGMLLLSMFHNVLPETLSISPRMILESCALNTGLPIGFSAVIVRAGVAAPLPLLPLPLLPLPGRLGSVVARSLRPLEGTLWYINVDSDLGQSSRVDDM